MFLTQDRGPSVDDSKATENRSFSIGTNFPDTIPYRTILNRPGWKVWRDVYSKDDLTCLKG
jgi:hypothetical protein